LNATVPVGLERIIGRALEKDREFRYQSAAVMRDELDAVLRERSAPFDVLDAVARPHKHHPLQAGSR
jgi:hypothetical protein